LSAIASPIQRTARAACVLLWTSKKSQIESGKHQDDADIDYQPFPELASEELEIYTDYDDHHRHHVKHDSHLSAHVSKHSANDPYCGGHATPCGDVGRRGDLADDGAAHPNPET
jgi:hypothetical protein